MNNLASMRRVAAALMVLALATFCQFASATTDGFDPASSAGLLVAATALAAVLTLHRRRPIPRGARRPRLDPELERRVLVAFRDRTLARARSAESMERGLRGTERSD
jgi:hypothetical protein